MTLIKNDIEIACNFLRKGDIIAIPTETVYGLAGNAYNERSVLKIFKIKNRPKFDPLIVHTYSVDRIKEFTKDLPEKALKLAQKFWPGPLTLVLKKEDIIPDIVTSGLEYVGVRIPNHELTLQLLKKLKFPLAAPSANKFGYISPTEPKHILKQFNDIELKLILDGGKCSKGIESTIIGFNNGDPVLYRPGAITIEEIENTIGSIKTISKNSKFQSPGMLKSHYAPRKPLFIGQIEYLLKKFYNKKVNIISFSKKYRFQEKNIIKYFTLTKNESLDEAAINLFSILHEADDNEAEIIIAEYCPDFGLGKSINDRLIKASFKEKS